MKISAKTNIKSVVNKSTSTNPLILSGNNLDEDLISLIVDIAKNNPNSRFIIQGCRDKVRKISEEISKHIPSGRKDSQTVIFQLGCCLHLIPLSDSIAGLGYGVYPNEESDFGLYLAFVSNEDEMEKAKHNIQVRCATEKTSAVIVKNDGYMGESK